MIVKETKTIEIGISAILWEVKEGKIIAIKYNDEIYKIHKEKTKKQPQPKEEYLKKWIRQNDIKRFNLKQFFKDYPNFARNDYKRRLHKTISNMIERNELIQLGNDEFQVL